LGSSVKLSRARLASGSFKGIDGRGDWIRTMGHDEGGISTRVERLKTGMSSTVKARKKLIEVALPLEAINIASAREKSIRHGHPSTLHLWWARRPLAAARAVIFAQMVDDPSSHPDIFRTEKAQEKERQRLFKIIEDLVQWENTTNEEVLERARAEIWQSWRSACADYVNHPRAKELFDRHKLPAFHDPFAGGGALPLEAQRLGLESYASDLNPVAVLINKAMIEIPPKFADKPPVNPEARSKRDLIAREWHGARGLAEDVRYYGKWMRDEAEKRIGHLYPSLEVTSDMVRHCPDLEHEVGKKLTVIAWLWVRTVKSPNPAFAHVDVPLASTFILSTRVGKEAYVEPVIEGNQYRFTVRTGKPKNADAAKNGTKLSRGANFQCLMSDTPIASEHIYSEANAGRMGARLMAIVVECDAGRVYLEPTPEMEAIALTAEPTWKPELQMPENPRWFSPPLYGLKAYGDLFTARQLKALTTFSDLVTEARKRVHQDAMDAGLTEKSLKPITGGTDATAYADAISTYLAFCVDKMTDTNTCLCSWQIDPPRLRATFGRQALPMVWDYAEANIFGDAAGDYGRCVGSLAEVLENHLIVGVGSAFQQDATTQTLPIPRVFSTDPPYYDNIGYADLSDFFYIWLRRSLRSVFPDLFATVAVPKAEELVATPYRHGGKANAEKFFLDGMTAAMHRLAAEAHPAYPITIYYAFKQAETEGAEGTSSTGWETFLDAVMRAGFAVSGTWPVRSELRTRNIGRGNNALASSIVLVCRQRSPDAPVATRREFLTALTAELPVALKHLQRGNIAPVDLAQAAIGPGMGVYTRYAKVLGAAGDPLPVKDALALINQVLDEALAEQEGDFDADTRWALAWFEQSGFDAGEYGVAETLSKAKNTSVAGMVDAKFLSSKGGKVRLLRPDELPTDWDPATDPRLTAWEVVHQLIRVLEAGGEGAAAELVAKLGSKAESARELAYRLYTICDHKRRTAQAQSYNALVQSWPEITRLAADAAQHIPQAVQSEFELT
jgi:putative DNA methylase